MLEVLIVLVCLALGWAYHIVLIAAALWLWALLTSGWLPWVFTHPVRVTVYAAGYFLVGAAWSVVKWWFTETTRAKEARDRYRKDLWGRQRDEVEANKLFLDQKTDVATAKGEIPPKM